MHRSKIFLIIGIGMLIMMVLLIAYALQHPEGSFSLNLRIAYILYLAYFVFMMAMFVFAAMDWNK